MDPWPLELNEEHSPARLSKRHFLLVAPSSCKDVHWLLLNARKKGQGVSGPCCQREPWISLRIHAGDSSLLQEFYYLLAVTQLLITGQQMLSGLAAGAVRGTASGKMWITGLKPAESVQGWFEMLGCEPWTHTFYSALMAGVWRSVYPTKTQTKELQERWQNWRASSTCVNTSKCDLTPCPRASRGSCPAQPWPIHSMNYYTVQDLHIFLSFTP